MSAYKRVLLKVSGEMLSGGHKGGVDPTFVQWLAAEVKQISEAGIELLIVVGGGNMVRGAEVVGNGIQKVTGDQMGMLSGMINALAVKDIFESEGIAARCLSTIFAEQVVDSYSPRVAEKHLSKKHVVLLAGGMSRPFFTHDSAAVTFGLEMGCDVVLKSTKVDGIYDEDPAKHADAQLFETISYQRAIEDQDIKVMDKAALGIAMDQHIPVIVFNLAKEGNALKAASGEKIGTLVS